MKNRMESITSTDSHALAHLESDPYAAALATWLEGKPANTRRSYAGALRDFLASTERHPAEVTPLDVALWKEGLKARGLADSTIAQRLSAVSSWYTYLQRPQADGQPLHGHNPVDGVDRADLEISPYDRARKVNPEDFRRLLAVIPADTVAGARDRALFLWYVLCARRRSEVIGLRGRDLRLDGQRLMYRVRLKGGKVKWKELPPPVWAAVQGYLELAGRTLHDDAPLFVATVDAGQHLRAYYGATAPDGEQPLSGEAVSQALSRYAARAGLNPEQITLHSLRHLGAELFQKAGGDVRQTQLFLDHAQLNTTQIYLEQLTGEEHRHWQAMANALGVA
ncbi:MAG: tyrosine-type recombinase/integrase [Anaerolineales bacterium]|nr:tyrosine-type recombinase/integrase [Anaerolineales bacterium]